MYRRAVIAAAAVLTSVSLGAARSSSSVFVRHLDLVKSEPAEGTTVAPPTEIRLWFTEAPEPGTASIRLLNSSEELVPTGGITASPDEANVFSVSVETPPPDGEYIVAWRAMADDGHVATERFRFNVQRSE